MCVCVRLAYILCIRFYFAFVLLIKVSQIRVTQFHIFSLLLPLVGNDCIPFTMNSGLNDQSTYKQWDKENWSTFILMFVVYKQSVKSSLKIPDFDISYRNCNCNYKNCNFHYRNYNSNIEIVFSTMSIANFNNLNSWS